MKKAALAGGLESKMWSPRGHRVNGVREKKP